MMIGRTLYHDNDLVWTSINAICRGDLYNFPFPFRLFSCVQVAPSVEGKIKECLRVRGKEGYFGGQRQKATILPKFCF